MRNVVPLFTVKPTHCGYIHVLLFGDEIGVEHESRSGESRALLKMFDLDQRDNAIRFAQQSLPDYAPCEIGEITPCLS